MHGIGTLFRGGYCFLKASRERLKSEEDTNRFKNSRNWGAIPLGQAVLTSAGRLSFQGIIHVAGISMWWRASEKSIRDSVRNALILASDHKYQSVALPLIGAGTGGGSEENVLEFMKDELASCEFAGTVIIVCYSPTTTN